MARDLVFLAITNIALGVVVLAIFVVLLVAGVTDLIMNRRRWASYMAELERDLAHLKTRT